MSSSGFMIFFGSVWTGMIFFMTVIMIISGAPLYFLSFLSIFWIVGITFLVIGIRKLLIDKKTDKYGEVVYGKIVDVYFSGTTVNNRREFKADFLTYIPSEGKVRRVSEIIGFNPVEYPVNAYIKGKFYNGDINVDEVISIDLVPTNVMDSIENGVSKTPGIEYSGYDYTPENNPISSNGNDDNTNGGIKWN